MLTEWLQHICDIKTLSVITKTHLHLLLLNIFSYILFFFVFTIKLIAFKPNLTFNMGNVFFICILEWSKKCQVGNFQNVYAPMCSHGQNIIAYIFWRFVNQYLEVTLGCTSLQICCVDINERMNPTL